MGLKQKLFSRKLWITVSVLVITTTLKFFGKLDDLYFSIILITVSIIYLFIEGSLDVKDLKIKTPIVELNSSPNDRPNDSGQDFLEKPDGKAVIK